MWLTILTTTVLSYVAWSLLCLESNYRRATKMRIPLVRLPVDPLNVPWQVFESHIWRLIDSLPFQLPLPTWTTYARRGWYFGDKAKSHLRYGSIWALVTPADIHIMVCDKDAVCEVMERRREFGRRRENYTLLEVYGPTIASAGLVDWKRHRKVLAAPFNENAMAFVWQEALRQTQGLVKVWTSACNDKKEDGIRHEDGITTTAQDTRTLSLNVMAACGFQKSFDFSSASSYGTREEEEELLQGKGRYDYREALQIVLDNVILLMLLPWKRLGHPWFPRKLRVLGKAARDFKWHMERMLEEETDMMKRGEKGSGSLMTSLVRAMDDGTANININGNGDDEKVMKGKGLSVDEIFGNIFVINFAGHDTTANTLAFSMLLLAAYPEVQDWVGEEVREVTRGMEVGRWGYGRVFPGLKRCRAILLETLRLYPPIISLPKWTTERPTELRVGNRTITIPPRSGINPSVLATHVHPDYWTDPLEWKPSRWIIPNSESSDIASERLFEPPKGTFYPWSDGPQICLGVKFSQVEFVAVMAALLKETRLEVVREEGETNEDVVERVRGVTEDCDMQMLLRMKAPERVKLRCRRVE